MPARSGVSALLAPDNVVAASRAAHPSRQRERTRRSSIGLLQRIPRSFVWALPSIHAVHRCHRLARRPARQHLSERSPRKGRSGVVAADRRDDRVGDLPRRRRAAEIGRVQRRVGGDALDRAHQPRRPPAVSPRCSSIMVRRSRTCRSDWRCPCR